jgi:flagellum-specific ATP synthase
MYTVLVDGDDFNEPISDTVRSILDGHIILSRKLAAQNHFPAIDILNSVSRCMIDIVSPEHLQATQKLKTAYAVYKEAEDMINVGAYVAGKNQKIDYAISKYDDVTKYLQQGIDEQSKYKEDIDNLIEMMGDRKAVSASEAASVMNR